VPFPTLGNTRHGCLTLLMGMAWGEVASFPPPAGLGDCLRGGQHHQAGVSRFPYAPHLLACLVDSGGWTPRVNHLLLDEDCLFYGLAPASAHR